MKTWYPVCNIISKFKSARTKWKWLEQLIRLLSYLRDTVDEVLILEADNTETIRWYVDATFAVHKDMKCHTGAVMTMGSGEVHKQKVNARSSTEAELVAVDDVIAKILWTKMFIEWQGFQVKLNILYQENTSTMILEINGKTSCGKWTRHFDIKRFHVTNLGEKLSNNWILFNWWNVGRLLY